MRKLHFADRTSYKQHTEQLIKLGQPFTGYEQNGKWVVIEHSTGKTVKNHPATPIWRLLGPNTVPGHVAVKRNPITDDRAKGKLVPIECDCHLGGGHERWCELWKAYGAE